MSTEGFYSELEQPVEDVVAGVEDVAEAGVEAGNRREEGGPGAA